MKKRKKKSRKPSLTHARVIRMPPRRRMTLGIKDMPKYPGANRVMVGETRNYYSDGHSESRRQRGGML